MKLLVLITALALVLIFPSISVAYYPSQYHQCFANNSKCYLPIKEMINKISGKNHRYKNYHDARILLFGKLHAKQGKSDNYVRDKYCNKQYSVRKNRIPSGRDINCEHTWPKSRFSGRHSYQLQKSDLHHLFPTDSQTNNTRGSHFFGECSNSAPVSSQCSSSEMGLIKSKFGSFLVFTPPKSHRGNVARALFYFSIRYNLKINNFEEKFLRKWHHEDPVDREELRRNEEIMKFQGNRNPFVDYQKLEQRVKDF